MRVYSHSYSDKDGIWMYYLNVWGLGPHGLGSCMKMPSEQCLYASSHTAHDSHPNPNHWAPLTTTEHYDDPKVTTGRREDGLTTFRVSRIKLTRSERLPPREWPVNWNFALPCRQTSAVAPLSLAWIGHIHKFLDEPTHPFPVTRKLFDVDSVHLLHNYKDKNTESHFWCLPQIFWVQRRDLPAMTPMSL